MKSTKTKRNRQQYPLTLIVTLLILQITSMFPFLSQQKAGKLPRGGRKMMGWSRGKEVDSVAAKAYILIETAVNKNREVVVALQKLKGVASVDSVTGPYDVIAIIHGETLNDIGELVTGKIHPTPGIARTVTCLAI